MKVVKVEDSYQVECKGVDKVNGHCPSVNELFHSIVKTVGGNVIGVILTDMGEDSAQGLLEMRRTAAK